MSNPLKVMCLKVLNSCTIFLQEFDMDKRTLKEVGENSPWSLSCLHKWRSLLFVVDDLQTRQLIQDVITTFEVTVLPKRERLPHGKDC